MGKNNPASKGEQSEAIIMAEFLKKGKVVLIPFGYNHRYDLVIEEDGIFTRIQCKTGILRDGTIRFMCCSQNNVTLKKKDYRGQIEKFAVYCPQNGKVYILPVEDVGTRACWLRVDNPKNGGNQKTIKYARDYELK